MKLADLRPRVVRLLGNPVDEEKRAENRDYYERNKERERQRKRDSYWRLRNANTQAHGVSAVAREEKGL